MDDKLKLLHKHNLKNVENCWWSLKENTHHHKVIKDSFIQSKQLIDVLFRINKLCYAKLIYFREHISEYSFLKHDTVLGFVDVELWDCDFFKHIKSGKIIDIRYLQTITIKENFINFINSL